MILSNRAAETRHGGARVRLSTAERRELQRWVRSRISPHRVAVRSRIVLLASRGLSATEIAAHLRVAPATVRLWTKRFEHGGPAALAVEAPGRGRPRGASPSIDLIVLQAARTLVPTGVSVRRVAARAGVSASTVWRIWKRHHVGGVPTAQSLEAAMAKLISETPGWGR